ncbi:MAG: hypothetical protein ACR2LI_17130 [Propionibacteriaceae bacterium]
MSTTSPEGAESSPPESDRAAAENHDADADHDQHGTPIGRRARRGAWWILLGTFVVGVVVGVMLVGLLSVGTPDFVTQSRQAASSSSSPRPSASFDVAAQAQVNAACLRVINEAQDVYSAVTGLDQAVNTVDLQALDDIVRRLQPIEPRLASDLQDCEVTVGAPVEPGGSTSAVVPTPSSSATG